MSKIVKKGDLQDFLQKGWIFEKKHGKNKYEVRKPKKWEKFEFDTRKFLEEIGLEDVDGGRDFKLGGWQIDACGGCDDYFLVIECRSADKPVKKDIRSMLPEFSGKREAIEEDMLKKYRGKYAKIIQVLCVKDIDPSKDSNVAEQCDIEIWSSDYLQFYTERKDYLGETAKYHVLADMRLNLPSASSRPRPAFKINLQGHTFYTFLIDADSLLKIGYVFRRGIAGSKAYQRALIPRRLDGIRKFIEEGGFFVNNIIVNFKQPFDFNAFSEISQPEWGQIGLVNIPGGYCSAQIVDGQHRLYGFAPASPEKKKQQLVVTAFEELEEDEQARFFLTINREQKAVNTNLLWDLTGNISPKTSQGVISRLVKRLESEDRSLLKGEIFVPAKHITGRGKSLKIGNICSGIKRHKIISDEKKDQNKSYNLWKGNADMCLEESYKIFRRYFEVIGSKFDFDWGKKKKGFMLSNNGVNVMLYILREFLIWKKGGEPSRKEFEEILDPIAKWLKGKRQKSIDDMRRRCSNEGERRKVAIDMMELIHEEYEQDKDYKNFGIKTLADDGRI